MADSYPEFGFKFAIGDDVFFGVTVRECTAMNITADEKKRLWKEARPQRFTVVERHLQECYGGIQRHYDLMSASPMGSMEIVVGIVGGQTAHGYFRATEHQLVAASADGAAAPAK